MADTNYYFPWPFVVEAVGSGTFDSLTGLTTVSGADDCPVPDFPIESDYIDVVQVQTYSVPQLERRIMTAHKHPKKWNLSYSTLTYTEKSYLENFWLARNGAFDSFLFYDPDEWWLNSQTEVLYRVRFASLFPLKRPNKNFYEVSLVIQEVF